MSAEPSLLKAALEVLPLHGSDAAFGEICALAGVSRATGYRAFPAGTRGVIDALERQTLVDVIRAIRDETEPLRIDNPTFDFVVERGLRGAIRGLRDAAYAQAVLRSDADAATTFLLSRHSGSLFSVLSLYVARCAASFGSASPHLRIAAGRFVWTVFAALLMDFPERGEPWPDPSDEAFAALLSGPVREFVDELNLVDRRQDGMLLPDVSIPALATS